MTSKHKYVEAEKTMLINFGSKSLRPIRINLPSSPPMKLITGYGLPPSDQRFKRLEVPDKLVKLEKYCYDYFKEKRGATNYEIIELFWDTLKEKAKEYEPEIKWMKHFIWHMHNGYWCFLDGQPTYIPGWHFSYLHLHYMTLDKGEGYPEFNIRQNNRFIFREYIFNTTETFVDFDEKGHAVKVDGKYRMKDVGRRVFLGTIEPKGRREGLTNETCHIITRIMTETKGADNLGTIVSMDGDNAGTHFKQKLMPAYKRWPLWLKPIWKGGVTDITFNVPKGVLDPSINVLGSTVNYTDSGSDTSNDGKKIMAALFDEQGKGKRVGNVMNRWQINKETMSLEAGRKLLGWCIHPSTVEKMEEGGQDYKEMCDLSEFYRRNEFGQTVTGLCISYMPSSYCLRGFTDVFGKAVLHRPTDRQKILGYTGEIGSQTYISRYRQSLYNEKDPKSMDAFRSFVRKFPEDYADCWKGVAGYIGFPIEQIENRITELENFPRYVRGNFKWVNNIRFGSVFFEEDDKGKWYVAKTMTGGEANLKTSMEYYSAMEDDYVPMMRPLYPKFIVGVDPHEFNNKGDSVMLQSRFTKLSDTGMVVLQMRDKNIDKSDFDKKGWKTRRAVAAFEGRMSSNELVAEEALKVSIYYGGLIHLERNKTEVWSNVIKWKYGGYLNHNAEVLPTGEVQVEPQPGTFMSGTTKKKAFSLAKDQLVNHVHIEPLLPLLKQTLAINAMEELTKFDMLAAWMNALIGAESIYPEMMNFGDEHEEVLSLGIQGRQT